MLVYTHSFTRCNTCTYVWPHTVQRNKYIIVSDEDDEHKGRAEEPQPSLWAELSFRSDTVSFRIPETHTSTTKAWPAHTLFFLQFYLKMG